MIGIKCYQTISADAYRFESRINQDKKYRGKYNEALQSLNYVEENNTKYVLQENPEIVKWGFDPNGFR